MPLLSRFTTLRSTALRRMFAPTRVLLFSLLAATGAEAEPRKTIHQPHGWYNYFGDHPIGDSRWGLHLEGQWRRHDVVLRGQQLLLRPAINFDVNKNLQLSAGYALARSYRYGEAPIAAGNDEHRIWQQALLRYPQGKLRWSTRIRFEERFLERIGREPHQDKYRHENRLRLMQQVRIPLQGKTYVTAYNEYWTYVKPYVSRSSFDQNRAYAAVGWQLNPHWRVETGYMHQAILQRSGSVLESNHTVMVSLFSSAPFGK